MPSSQETDQAYSAALGTCMVQSI